MRFPFDFDGWLERAREHLTFRHPRPGSAALPEHRTPAARRAKPA